MISKYSIPSRLPSVVSKKIKGEYLLVPLASDIADMDSLYKLNETGAFIWDAIDGVRSVYDITLMVVKEFDADLQEAEKDTTEFITAISKFLDLDKK
jgi:hypothetical protein